MTLDAQTFRALVAEAALSPSVHNTQPTRWRLTSDGRVQVLEDEDRRLPVGDPEGRDLNVSHGSAVEGSLSLPDGLVWASMSDTTGFTSRN